MIDHMVDFKLQEFSLTFSFNPSDDLITDLISHLAQSKFQLKKLDDVEFRFKKLQEIFPRMSLRDETQAIRIELSNNKFEINIDASSFMLSDNIKQKESVFSKENLSQYNSDINYIIGALMSTLHIQKLKTEVEVTFESENVNINFNHLLSHDIILKNKSKITLEGIQIEVSEEIFSLPSKVTYRFWDTKEQRHRGIITFKQEMVLPIQLDKMIYTLKDCFHDTLNQVITK